MPTKAQLERELAAAKRELEERRRVGDVLAKAARTMLADLDPHQPFVRKTLRAARRWDAMAYVMVVTTRSGEER
jgi:hypothetical protein